MPNDKMLIDASHPEETRVVLLRGNRIEEFDFESQAKKQLRGNIYLAKVTRVEPSLQAAFVEYGGNRHGFLAFSEIHPDYYQIPYADRQALLAEDAEEDDRADADANGRRRRGRHKNAEAGKAAARRVRHVSAVEGTEDGTAALALEASEAETNGGEAFEQALEDPGQSRSDTAGAEDQGAGENAEGDEPRSPKTIGADIDADEISEEAPDAAEEKSAKEPAPAKRRRRTSRKRTAAAEEPAAAAAGAAEAGDAETAAGKGAGPISEEEKQESGASQSVAESAEYRDDKPTDTAAAADADEEEHVESVGQEDALEEVPQRRRSQRSYKIQEVIKRRQIMLVQVVKEERGNKGAALTTYLSLAGRYCVLMPNTGRGGGISRKITSAADRKRLKEIAGELEVPQGMGVILRTAGANRNKAEIRRDFEYLLRLWENVRNLTLASTAPCLVYEEGSLVKRSIRDLYDKDTGEILVQGEAGYREAKDFMRMLMPSHAKNVKLYNEDQSIFARHNVEAQLDRLLAPQVTLKSGGYLVINQTEALVSIDVNSGKSTREHSIEDTALRTNLEASDEVARQLRLRDLAGLIVIDFIDMEEKRNNRAVEKRLKDALKNDRARIQVGRISHFGLLEMSRQRIRVSVMESTMDICPHCQGLGHVRSHSSIALHVFRSIEDHLLRHSRNNVTVRCPVDVALEILNSKRSGLSELENRYGVRVTIFADASLPGQTFALEKGEPATGKPVRSDQAVAAAPLPDEEEVVEEEELVESVDDAAEREIEQADGRRKRRRRRGRRGGDYREEQGEAALAARPEPDEREGARSDEDEDAAGRAEELHEGRRRRGRRGRRLRGRDRPREEGQFAGDNVPAGEGLAVDDVEADDSPARLDNRGQAYVGATASETLASPERPDGNGAAEARAASEPAAQQPGRPRRNTRRATASGASEAATQPDEAPEAAADSKRVGWWRRGFL